MLPRSILRDAHFALRGFRRAPAFVATVVLTIALALGLNTTVFTIFDAYVLRPAAVRDTVGAVVGQSLRLAAVGVAVGAVLAVGASRVLESMLVVVRTFDVAGYGGGVIVALLSCVAAAYAPARRAARVEPTEALRAECAVYVPEDNSRHEEQFSELPFVP